MFGDSYRGRTFGLPLGWEGSGASSGAGFDPTTDPQLSSGLILDLCPDYLGTLTLNAGVQQINDRSPAANNFSQPIASQRPTYLASDPNYGGRASMGFNNGVGSTLQSLLPVVVGTGQVTVAVVLRFSALVGTVFLAPTNYTNVANVAFASGWNQAGVTFISQAARNGSFLNAISPVTVANTVYRYAGQVDTAAVNMTAAVWLNNVLASSNNAASGTPGPMTALTWNVGSTGTSGYMSGSIARVLAWNRLLSPAEMTTLDNGLKSFFGQATTFSPTDLPDLLTWMDSRDNSTITKNSSGRISDWNSKAGSFAFTQATAINKPLLDTNSSINSLQAINFDGSVNPRSMLGSFTYAGGSSAITAYVVGKLTTVVGNVQTLVGPSGGSSVRVGANNAMVRLVWDGGAGQTVWDEPAPLGTAIGRRVCLQIDLSGPNAAIAGTIDNAPLTGGYTTGPNPVGVAGATTMEIGDGPLAGNNLDGYIGEILVYKGLHDAPTRALVDNYLKNKWGL